MKKSSRKNNFPAKNSSAIKKIRQAIDALDEKILRSIEERMSLALRLRRLKDRISDPQREKQVLYHFKKHTGPLLSEKFTVRLAEELIKESKLLQGRKFKLIGFQGEKGAYSEEAALKYDPQLIPMPFLEFKELFDGISNNFLDYGIVPVENSTEGQVSGVGDLLISSHLKIVAEINYPVHHCLLALPGTDRSQVKTVFSHLQALGQCRHFLQKYKLEPKPFYDTAGAARMLAERQPKEAGVIASKKCAQIYGLQVLKENIEDFPRNRTRFLIISKQGLAKGDKCSLAFSLKNRPGALSQILLPLAERSINLTRLESRPNKNHPGEYFFLLDFEGSLTEEKIRFCLKELKKRSLFFRFLGCYPVLN